MAAQRAVSTEEVEAYAAEAGLLFLETSAKDNTNITEIFEKIAVSLPAEVAEPQAPRRKEVDLKAQGNQAGGCAC